MSEARDTATATAIAIDLRVILSRLRRRLREVSSTSDLSPSQVSILSRLLKDGQATVSDLARVEGVRPQSLGATVAVLESLGYVNRRSDPSDGRRALLTATDEAVAIFTADRAAKTDWLVQRLVDTLSTDELDRVAVAVALLGRLDAGPATPPSVVPLTEQERS